MGLSGELNRYFEGGGGDCEEYWILSALPLSDIYLLFVLFTSV
jgi:hypothetical protein